MPDQHRELFGKLPFLIVGSLDAQRRPWASILVGRPGFVSSPDPRTLRIDARAGYGDPLGANIARRRAASACSASSSRTRRRNRMNGTIVARDGRRLHVHVGQSFGNCPQYIQARIAGVRGRPGDRRGAAPRCAPKARCSRAAARALVRGADTFFIATAAPAAASGSAATSVDVSHRGGRPGFVRVTEEDGRDRPDLAGLPSATSTS